MSDALKLADRLENAATVADMGRRPEKNDALRLAAAELRRLHGEVEKLTDVCRRVSEANINATFDLAEVESLRAENERLRSALEVTPSPPTEDDIRWADEAAKEWK